MLWAHGRSGQKTLILAAWLERVKFILHSVDKQCSSKLKGVRDKIIIRVNRKDFTMNKSKS